MRFNSTELKNLATSPNSVCQKEGLLSLREKEGKLWKKTDVLTSRWCRLIGNLLFYMKGKNKNSEPVGVFVLEKFTVNSYEEPYSFLVEFQEDRSAYFLANSPVEAAEWIEVLKKASYSHLKQRYTSLKKEVEKFGKAQNQTLELSLRCSDLSFPTAHAEPVTMVCVHLSAPSHAFWTPHSQTDIVYGSHQPIFFKTVSFYDSDCITLDSKLRFIVYRIKKQNTNNVEEVGCCYCVVGDLIGRHEVVLDLHLNGNCSGKLRASVIKQRSLVKHRENTKATASGKVLVSVDPGLAESVKQCTQEGPSLGSNSLLEAMYFSPYAISYRFPTEDENHISVQELMLESCLSFHVPISFLKLCIDEETKRIASYKGLGQLTPHWSAVREARVETCKKYLDRYNSRMKHLMLNNKPPYFKKSADKTVESLEFVPTNLHLQRLRVQNSKYISDANFKSLESSTSSSSSQTERRSESASTDPCFEYDIITVGASAAHSMGFKQGGLFSQLANEGGKSKKNIPLHSLNQCLRKASRSDQLISSILQLEQQITYQIEKLRTLASQASNKSAVNLYSADRLEASHEALASLSTKTCELVTLLDASTLSSAMEVLAAARPMCSPVVDAESATSTGRTVSGPSVMVNGASHVAVFNSSATAGTNVTPENAWEDLKLSVRATLAEVVKSVHMVITPDLEKGFLRGEASSKPQHHQATEDLSKLKLLVSRSCDQASSATSFQELSRNDTTSQQELAYRRKVVFSQALGACVCGVSTAIASSISDELRLHQFSEVGILYQVESLVSTYGSELGMLQDYAVGVMDLQNVTFKCVRASQQQARMSLSDQKRVNERMLPTLHGSTDALTVLIPVDDTSFELLPSKLKSGRLMKVHPVIYNVGINEEQTLAEKFGNTALQEYLNMEAVQRTLSYYDSVRDSCPNCITERLRNAQSFVGSSIVSSPRRSSPAASNHHHPDEKRSVVELLNILRTLVHSKKNKNVEILQLAGDICRRLNAVRVTSCKSAKDRTAMSVTLEQVRVLSSEHRLARNVFNQALNCMRSEGTRLHNTSKNVGARKYAFTSVQLLTFPKQYRPPEGTYGKTES